MKTKSLEKPKKELLIAYQRGYGRGYKERIKEEKLFGIIQNKELNDWEVAADISPSYKSKK